MKQHVYVKAFEWKHSVVFLCQINPFLHKVSANIWLYIRISQCQQGPYFEENMHSCFYKENCLYHNLYEVIFYMNYSHVTLSLMRKPFKYTSDDQNCNLPIFISKQKHRKVCFNDEFCQLNKRNCEAKWNMLRTFQTFTTTYKSI